MDIHKVEERRDFESFGDYTKDGNIKITRVLK